MEKYNIKTFIKKSNEIHNNKYDYTNIIWKNVGVKVSIKCNEHGNFEQTPSNHLMGKGCSYCSGVGRITKDIFLERAKKVHSEKYEYILNDDKITNTKEVQIKCKIHGIFLQTPKNHLKGQCCPKCSKYYKYNQSEFIEKCINIHNNKYDYSKVNYIKNSINITIICKIHGEFEQLPLNHLKGNGCYRCSGFNRNTEDFINKAKEIHGDIYDYSKVNYENTRKSVIITCKIHGEFEQIPNYHLSGCGCTKCQFYSHSKVCLRWLNQIEKNLGYKIRHMNNEGEMKTKVNNKLIKFDGFDPKTNTVYEFHGSMWHGDPRVYKSTDINPVNKKLYGDLYSDTLKREELIKKLGYNLIIMWEKDFK